MEYIPVIAPIGINGNEIYNINADNLRLGLQALGQKSLFYYGCRWNIT